MESHSLFSARRANAKIDLKTFLFTFHGDIIPLSPILDICQHHQLLIKIPKKNINFPFKFMSSSCIDFLVARAHTPYTNAHGASHCESLAKFINVYCCEELIYFLFTASNDPTNEHEHVKQNECQKRMGEKKEEKIPFVQVEGKSLLRSTTYLLGQKLFL